MPLALAVIGDIIPPRERARYQGYMMAVFASASVLGPVLGGLLAGTDDFLGVAGWRWIFYINVPIAAVALFVIARVLKLDSVRRERRIDWWGALTLVVGLVPLLVVAEEGQQWGWASVASFTCYLLSAAGLIVFVWIQHRMGDDALLPLRMFRSRTFSVASGQVTIIGMAMFGGLSVIPLYLQIVKGASPTKSGLLLLPLVGGLMLASLGSGRLIARTGRYKIFPVVGSVLMVIGMGLFITLRADTALWSTDIYMAIFGIGLGMNMQSLVLAMQNAVPARVAALHQHLSGGLDDTSFLSGLAKPLAHPFFVGFSSAGDVVFAITAILLVAAIVLSSSLKEVPLRLVSGNQARAQASESDGAVAQVVAAAGPVDAVRASAAGDTSGDDDDRRGSR
jgi:predicted MFS family arabinose efflux permease